MIHIIKIYVVVGDLRRQKFQSFAFNHGRHERRQYPYHGVSWYGAPQQSRIDGKKENLHVPICSTRYRTLRSRNIPIIRALRFVLISLSVSLPRPCVTDISQGGCWSWSKLVLCVFQYANVGSCLGPLLELNQNTDHLLFPHSLVFLHRKCDAHGPWYVTGAMWFLARNTSRAEPAFTTNH